MQRARHALDSPALTRGIQLAAVLSLILAVFVGVKQYELAGCLAGYNNAYAKASAARVQASDQDRAAEDAMWQAFQDAGNPAKVAPTEARAYAKAAFDRYIEQRRQARDSRARHPLPAPPSQTC